MSSEDRALRMAQSLASRLSTAQREARALTQEIEGAGDYGGQSSAARLAEASIENVEAWARQIVQEYEARKYRQ